MAVGTIETDVITRRSEITRKKSNNRLSFWPKMQEDGQSLDFAESVKVGKQMKGRDQSKAQSTARNNFAQQTCSTKATFLDIEMG